MGNRKSVNSSMQVHLRQKILLWLSWREGEQLQFFSGSIILEASVALAQAKATLFAKPPTRDVDTFTSLSICQATPQENPLGYSAVEIMTSECVDPGPHNPTPQIRGGDIPPFNLQAPLRLRNSGEQYVQINPPCINRFQALMGL